MEQIEGTVDSIIFRNDENGYVISRIKEDAKSIITIVGCIPYISEGQSLKLQGGWVIHPKFGRQFKVESCEEIIPDTKKGIEKYLASGIISGIGPVTAKKIVKKFGMETFNILENHIERLKEIEGIGDKKISKIQETYEEQKEVRNIIMFFQEYGISINYCIKIYKKFKGESIKIVKQNPYILTESIAGIGFKTADKIARNLGVDVNSPFRLQSGINYVVNQFSALGNTCMPIDKLIKEGKEILNVKEEDIKENILQNAIEGKLRVEIVEEKEYVFSIPYYYCELGVTKNILKLSLYKHKDLDMTVEEEIKKFENENNIEFSPSQREAIMGAFLNGVEIITGGPGTGKTTIINCISDIYEKYGYKVCMAAPTGRAAKRMTEATGKDSKTIHRLLEMGVGEEEIFSKSEETPLECDVVIIDEASMIDIMLMNSLLKAISIGTRLIIVGDVDQLPSVGAGNVLRDLIDSDCVKIVRLKDIFRQSENSMITINAHKINNGKMPILNEKDKDFFFLKGNSNEEILDILLGLVDKRLPRFNKEWDRLKHIQILSPMRKGVLGVENLNKSLQMVLNPPLKEKKEKKFKEYIFRVGDKIMQTKNNYNIKWEKIDKYDKEDGMGIFNGDIGYIEDINEENNNMTIIFDEEKKVIYEDMYLDEIDLAYAITIHKSQGSEFPAVIIPAFMGPPMLMNRNLLYTGITRAKELVVVVGKLKALKFMVDNNRSFERYSLLKWRIESILQNFNENDEQ